MIRSAALILAAILCTGGPAAAWNNFGHMEVAAAAWAQMTPEARQRATELLKRNPLYGTWVQGHAPGDRDRIGFIMAATWPDIIKRHPDYRNDGPDGGDRPPPEPEASQNIGYQDHFRHKYWHFIDKPLPPDPTKDPKPPTAQTEIAKLRATLPASSGASDDVRSYDLTWLLHIVGDVHQPLHATSRFTPVHPDGDNGGNSVKIHCGPGCSATVLHGFWDDLLGPSDATPEEAAAAAAHLPAADAARAGIADESVWITESFDFAQSDVYVPPIGVGDVTFLLDDAYKSKAHELAKQRVALAGARLANLINDALK